VRRLVVAVAGILLSVGVLSFAVGRIVLGVAGSPDAVASVVGDVTALPEVRDELVTAITERLQDDPLIAAYADPETVRSVVDTVLDGERFATFTDAASAAVYAVFFEGAVEATIDVNGIAFDAVDRLAGTTEVDELRALATEYGVLLEERGIIAPGTVDAVAEAADRIGSDLAEHGIDPIVIERTEDDLDFGTIVDSVRLWSTIGLVVAVLAVITILVVSPVALLRRFMPVGVALAVAGLLLLLVSRGTVVLSLDDVARADMIRAIAETLLGRATAPGYTLLIAGAALIGIGLVTRVIPERRR
jgi:hypothetical protein